MWLNEAAKMIAPENGALGCLPLILRCTVLHCTALHCTVLYFEPSREAYLCRLPGQNWVGVGDRRFMDEEQKKRYRSPNRMLAAMD
eukprot:9277857-Pyramimonas_sp.AAC.1